MISSTIRQQPTITVFSFKGRYYGYNFNAKEVRKRPTSRPFCARIIIKIFAEIPGKVVQKYDKVIIGMDSNARNSLWDNTCLVNPPLGDIKKMGLLL